MAQASRGIVHAVGDLGQARLDGVEGDRQEPHQIGENYRGDGAGQQKPGGDPEGGSHPRVHRIVHPGEGQQHSDRDHRAGDRVAHARDPCREHHGFRRAQSEAIGHQDRDSDGQHGGRGRQGKAIERQAREPRVDHLARAFHGPGQERPAGQQEPQEDRQKAGRKRECRPEPAQPVARQRPIADRGVMKTGAPPRPPLQQDEGEDEQQEYRRELGRRGRFAHAQPGPVNAGGEGVDGEVLDRAEIVQGLHERQRQAGDDTRPGQRQGDGEEAPPRPAAERPADLEHAYRLLEEGGPRQQVDVGIEHQRHHGDRAAQGPDLGEPVVLPRPPGGLSQRRLHRSGELEQAGVGIGDDIGRHGHRHQQRPLHGSATGKTAHGHQPGRPDPDD